MQVARMSCWIGLLVLTCGCGSARGPVVAGRLESGTFWKNPLSATNNEGGGYDQGSRVEIYDQFVVVTTKDGLSHVYPQGHYSGLVIKRD